MPPSPLALALLDAAAAALYAEHACQEAHWGNCPEAGRARYRRYAGAALIAGLAVAGLARLATEVALAVPAED